MHRRSCFKFIFLLSVLYVIEDVIYRSPFSVELRVELLMFLGAVLIVKVGRTTHVVQCKAVLVAYLCCVGCITDLVSSLFFFFRSCM